MERGEHHGADGAGHAGACRAVDGGRLDRVCLEGGWQTPPSRRAGVARPPGSRYLPGVPPPASHLGLDGRLGE